MYLIKGIHVLKIIRMFSKSTRYSQKVPGLFVLCYLFSMKKVKTLHTSGKNIFLHNNIYIFRGFFIKPPKI